MGCGTRILNPITFDSVVDNPEYSIFLNVKDSFFHFNCAPYVINNDNCCLIVPNQLMSFFNDTSERCVGERGRCLVGLHTLEEMDRVGSMMRSPRETCKYLTNSIFNDIPYPAVTEKGRLYDREITSNVPQVYHGNFLSWHVSRRQPVGSVLDCDLVTASRNLRCVTSKDVLERIFCVIDLCPCVDFFIWCEDLDLVMDLWPERNIFPLEKLTKKSSLVGDYQLRDNANKENLMFRDNVWLGIEGKNIHSSVGLAAMLCNGLFTYNYDQ